MIGFGFVLFWHKIIFSQKFTELCGPIPRNFLVFNMTKGNKRKSAKFGRPDKCGPIIKYSILYRMSNTLTQGARVLMK